MSENHAAGERNEGLIFPTSRSPLVGQVNYTKVLDEDSCEALSPEQPASQESHGSAPSPVDSKVPETPSPSAAPTPTTMLQVREDTADLGRY